MGTQPVDRPLNLTAQDFFTYGSWALTIALLIVAYVMCRRERTPFYLLVVLASMVAAFAEPIYDELMVLYFYTAHDGANALHTHFTAFDVPQPVWTHSGYAILYGGPAVYITYRIRHGGLTRRALYLIAASSFLESCAFEMIGINAGAYTYWGPHVLRVLDYPLAIGLNEMAQVTCFAIAAAQLRERVANPWQLGALFLIFPCTFALANYGAGAAMIVGLHAENTNELIRYATTLVTIGCALGLVRLAAAFLPASSPTPARDPEPRRTTSPQPVAAD